MAVNNLVDDQDHTLTPIEAERYRQAVAATTPTLATPRWDEVVAAVPPDYPPPTPAVDTHTYARGVDQIQGWADNRAIQTVPAGIGQGIGHDAPVLGHLIGGQSSAIYCFGQTHQFECQHVDRCVCGATLRASRLAVASGL